MKISTGSCRQCETAISHHFFSDLPNLLRAGDLLILNDTRVFRARLMGRIRGVTAEIFCLGPLASSSDPFEWKALVRPGGKLPPGSEVELAGGPAVVIGGRLGDGIRSVRLPSGISAAELFDKFGETPLPPYIKESSAQEGRYQTVYARPEKNKSAAAPTAGLHFTDDLFARLAEAGVERDFITLDVGIGTFRPVRAKDLKSHHMHSERCRVEKSVAERINDAKKSGRRVVAVGTTVVRTLESMADESGVIAPGEMDTDMFIRPGYRFKAIDALITNFHLPESTLLILVSAFAGYENIMRAYETAVGERYRFFSFGDAMLIG
jgi:S-adenosylmethionine:tRNA ribosyltransferase-isomerase